MKEYSKMTRIKYNNKLFDIYVDNNHLKNFLEVKIMDGIEKYYYPSIEDTVKLNMIYNNNSISISDIKNKKYKFEDNKEINNLMINHKILYHIYTIGISISFSSVMIGGALLLDKEIADMSSAATTQIEEINTTSAEEIKPIKAKEEVETEVKPMKYVEVEKATLEDSLNSLNKNTYLTDEQKKYIQEYIMCLNKKLPEVDYSILNANLKTLKISIEEENFQNSMTTGRYNSKENTMFFKNNISYKSENIFYHEMTHVLTEYFNNNMYRGFKGHYGYGRSITEARAEILTMYLITPTVNTFDEYLSLNNKSALGYNEDLIGTTYDLIKLTKDDFTIYDYLFSNVYEYEKVLTKYELEGIIDCLDIELDNYKNGLEIEDSMLDNYQDYINTLLPIQVEKTEEVDIPIASYFDPVTYEVTQDHQFKTK